jgi:hypothetical protein
MKNNVHLLGILALACWVSAGFAAWQLHIAVGSNYRESPSSMELFWGFSFLGLLALTIICIAYIIAISTKDEK